MTTHTNEPPLVRITDPEFASGYAEAQEPCFADFTFCTDMHLMKEIRAMLMEYAVEMGRSEQQLRRSTGFIIGIQSKEQQ